MPILNLYFLCSEVSLEQDIEKIMTIIEEKSRQFTSRMGDVRFAGVDGGTIKVAPTGFCWR